jgi:hypothetical protein
MAGEIYYQWQNEFMLNTIYPLREMKLRDFLIFYQEIDLWKQYKDKTPADLQGEVKTYQETQMRLRREAYDTYQALKTYFIGVDVAADYKSKYPVLEPILTNTLNGMRGLFKRYFPTYNNPAKENYFITLRIYELERLYKEVQREIGAIQRRIRSRVATWPDRPKNEERQKLLETVSLKVVEEELNKLRSFFAASTKIEKRRVELAKWQAQKLKEKKDIEIKLSQRQGEVAKLEGQHKDLLQSENRIKSPTVLEDLIAYFTKPDVTQEMRLAVPVIDTGFMVRVNNLHAQFKTFPNNPADPKNLAAQKLFVDNLLKTFTTNWRAFTGASGEMAKLELQKLKDFSDAIDLRSKPPEHAKAVVQQRESQRKAVETQLNNAKTELQASQSLIRATEQELSTPEVQLFSQGGQVEEVSVRDIVRAKVEDYRSQLSAKTHSELLELVIKRFLAEPKRFPIWLQYMVIHFSGMRYQSAHGSWADPRDLLASLNEKEVEREIRAADERMIEELCRAKVSAYEKALAQPAPGSGTRDLAPAAPDLGKPPALALATDSKWKAKAQNYLDKLKSLRTRYKVTPAGGKLAAEVFKDAAGTWQPGGQPALSKGSEVLVEPLPLSRDGDYFKIYEAFKPGYPGLYLAAADLTLVPDARKRKVLLDLRIDEETYEVEQADEKKVLEELRQLKERLNFPAWMWNEIVKLTDLRLKDVQTANWEQASEEEQAERLAYQWREFNALMNQWKQSNLTGWREEHDLSSKLVVTRAVCNEVAEHCQHLRGNSPPGGLTAKPGWYQRLERDPKLAANPEKPFLKRIKSAEDLKPGASILWLQYVYEEPNAWRIAHPIKLSSGEGLLTPPLNVPRGEDGGNQFDPKKGYVFKSASSWNYYQDSQGRYKRSRSVTTTEDKSYREVQWLRWIHEATVVDVAETADGPIVLTFETALPFEDKRRSTIGVFKHNLNWILYNVTGPTFSGSFTGFTPEGAVPYFELREMLDWNHMVQRENFVPQAQMEAYWKVAGYKFERDLAPGARMIQAEAAPLLKKQGENHTELIGVYEVDPVKKTAVPYNPPVEMMRLKIRRGMRMIVGDAVQIGAERYYKVVSCEAEPSLQDFYVRSVELVAAPRVSSDKPMSAKAALALYELKNADAQGLPVFEAWKKQPSQLPAGTRLLVSGVHKAAAADPGDGTTKDASGKRYALVLECPDLNQTAGLFVLADLLQPLTMEAYLHGAAGTRTVAPQEMRARVTPQDGTNQVVLYALSGKAAAKVPTNTLPRDAVLTVAASPVFADNMNEAFYKINASASKPALVGSYVNVEDVTLEIDVTG